MMNGKAKPFTTATIAATVLCASTVAFAQVPVDENGYPLQALEADVGDQFSDGEAVEVLLGPLELEELVGPVALYPDDLLAIVLPASTYPLQIVQAARFLEASQTDPSLQPSEEWDESVVALLNYPEVLRMMNEDIDWTWQLGDAVISQQQDVISAVESFRDQAYAAGNLKSDDRQTIEMDDGVIEIVPIEDDVIYVPYYEPSQMVIEQPRPVYHYYPEPCPVYYYPYAAGHRFRSGYFWGVTTAFRIGWYDNYLSVFRPGYWGHPYYGHSYYGHYYRRPSINVYNTWYVNNSRRSLTDRYRRGDEWRPRRPAGSRQSDYFQRTRSYVAESRDTRVREVRSGDVRFADRSSNRTANNRSQNRTRSTVDKTRRLQPVRERSADTANNRPTTRSNERRNGRVNRDTTANTRSSNRQLRTSGNREQRGRAADVAERTTTNRETRRQVGSVPERRSSSRSSNRSQSERRATAPPRKAERNNKPVQKQRRQEPVRQSKPQRQSNRASTTSQRADRSQAKATKRQAKAQRKESRATRKSSNSGNSKRSNRKQRKSRTR